MVDNSQICVSYQDDYGVWKYVEQELKAHLPLRNVILKTKTGSTKVVEKINLDLIPYDDERLQFPSQPTNWYRKPYLFVLFVQCEDNDVYKQLVKNKIKAWVQTMQERQQEWLIVYVSLSHRRFSELTSKLHRTVYDKIRADFNSKRCCQLRMSDDIKTEEFWDDTLMKIKEGIVSSIDQYIASYEEEIRKMDSRRKQPGWNFYGFFFLKESLAFTYERAQMFEDARIQYDELEILYLDKETTKIAGRFGGNDPGDDSSNLMADAQKKNIRDMIYQNTITEFDFRQYLFARQMKLLFALGRPSVVAERAMGFINGVSFALAKNKRALQDKSQQPQSPPTTPTATTTTTTTTTTTPQSLTQSQSQSQLPSSQQPGQPTPPPIPTIASIASPPHPYQQSAWVFSAATTIVDACETAAATIAALTPPSTPSTPSVPSTPTSAASTTASAVAAALTPGKILQPSLRFLNAVRAQPSQTNLSLSDKTPTTPTPARATTPSELGGSAPKGPEADTHMECLLADLVYLARSKLDILGREFKFLPTTSVSNPPLDTLKVKNTETTTTTSAEDTNATTTPGEPTPGEPTPTSTFSNPILQEAFQSESAFDKLYIDMTQKALELYTIASRRRSVVRMNFEMGYLYYHRSQYDKAETLLTAVSSTYGSDGWHALEYNARSILTDCERRLAHVREYISDCLALLAPNLPLSAEERLSYVDQIVSHAPNLAPPLVRELSPVFTVALGYVENKYTLGATIQVKCTITSTLPKPVLINKATLYLAQISTSTTPSSTPVLPRDNSSSSLQISKTKESPRMGSAYNISPVSSTTPGGLDDGINISVQDINLVPGPNVILFETEAKLKGQFVSTSLTLELGQLSFCHQMQYERATIVVTESTSKVSLVAKPPISLLLKIPQRVLLTISVGPEPLVAATLTLRSATGVQFIETTDETLVVVRNTTPEGTPGEIIRYQAGTLYTSANGNGKLALAALNANELFEVYVPVIANNEQPCVHQMRAELTHEKRTREMFYLAASVSLPFAHAFCATAVCVPVHSPSPRTLVQAILTSTAGDALTISDYSLSGPASIVHDPNALHIKGTAVRPNQKTSLVFCITTHDSSASQDITLDVTFSCPSPVPLLPPMELIAPVDVNRFSASITHSFSTVLALSLPNPQYRIEIRNPPTAYLAQPILFELLITQVQPAKSEESDVPVVFEIEEDPLWVISGKRKASLQMVAGTPASVSCRLRPISAGILPVPKVKLCGVPNSSFIVAPKGPPHVQVFPEPITSECNPIANEESSNLM